MMPILKDCTKCRQLLPIMWFARNRLKWSSCCKKCMAEYREKNKARILLQQKEWRQQNKPLLTKKNAAYLAANRDRNREKCREYFAKNKDVARLSKREYRKKNQTRVAASLRAYAEANRTQMNAYSHARRARKLASGGTYSAADLAEIRLMQRDKCGFCRIKLRGGGHVDHIIPIVAGGTNYRRNIQLLCAPCNLQKSAKPPEKFARECGLLL